MRVRLVHRIRHRWTTRHWDRSHFPGCPVRYQKPGECLGDLCDWLQKGKR